MLTQAATRDCIINGNKVIFIVSEGEAKKAIGKNGAVVRRIKELLNKHVEVVEFSNDPIKFIKNIFFPIHIDAYIAKKGDGRKIIHVIPKERNGRIKEKLKRGKLLIKKYFDMDVVLG